MKLNQIISNSYGTFVDNMSTADYNLLEAGLDKMTPCAVKDFAYRKIDRTGRSTVFSTSSRWHSINKDDNFLHCMLQHTSAELLYIKQHNLSFFTRSDDKINSLYLQYLEKCGVNNSVIRFKCNQEQIELFYFVTDPNCGGYRDLILNNLPYLDSITNLVQPVLELISKSLKKHNQQQYVLNDSAIASLWNDEKFDSQKSSNISNRRKIIKLFYQGKEIFLTTQEQKCFSLLKLGWSNKSIAISLNLSELTVKDHIAHLKRKFGVQSRDNLTEIAQLKTMQYVQSTEIL